MVEGPKVKLKAIKLKKDLINQLLISIEPYINEYNKILNNILVDIITIGKEMFFCFQNNNNHVLRLHFGMSGSERLVSSNDYVNSKSNDKPIKLQFNTIYLYLYNTIIQIKTYNYYLSVCNRLDCDVMSKLFNYNNVINKLTIDSRYISDSILDQTTLPGVGNIIKCESLFNSSIHPNRITNTLTSNELIELVKNIHSFSMKWYNSCISKKILFSYNIYGKDICTKCNNKVILVRDGQLQRITYYCNRCQPLIPSSNVISNSNLSTIESVDRIPEEVSNQMTNQQINESIDFLHIPICKCHLPCQLLRVRKNSINQFRLFFQCFEKKLKKCDFFQWADKNFPICKIHNKASILRRVLKPGINNGRYFYSCKESNCHFFEWVENKTDNSISSITTSNHTNKYRKLSTNNKLKIPL